MIVVDASAVAELILQTDLGSRVERRLLRDDAALHVPHLLDAEVVSALRRLVHAREMTADRAAQALDDLQLLRLIRHGHVDLLPRVWHLRQNLTAYDAIYLALAESLDATLVTCDQPFAGTSRRFVRSELIR